MRFATITRNGTSDQGTFGTLVLDDQWQCSTGELPGRQNQPKISCISAGTYTCLWMLSPRHGWCYHVQGVARRVAIEIHAANFCGDLAQGFKCELRGCIALGSKVGLLGGQLAVLNSAATLKAFNERLHGEPLELTIVDVVPIADTPAEEGTS